MEPHLRASLERVLEHPGSLIRPEIVLKVSSAFDVPPDRSIDLAIALEYFHTASLLFDDLPSMDDAAERRGVRCIHIDFGEASAMLAALALINRAYFLAWHAVAECDRDRRDRGLKYLEKYLGVGGLLNGQSMDLHYGDLPQNAKSTEAVAIGKTVSLIRLTLVLPALLGGASAVELRLLDRLAFFLGAQLPDRRRPEGRSAKLCGVGQDRLAGPRPESAKPGAHAWGRWGNRTAQSHDQDRRFAGTPPHLPSTCDGLPRRLASRTWKRGATHDGGPVHCECWRLRLIFLSLIRTNLLRHRIRSGISIAGIAFSVAAMLTVVTVLQGAVAMFSGILSNDSEIIVFERNVSDLFFSDVPPAALTTIRQWDDVQHADPVLFGVVSSAEQPIITCFGITAEDARMRNATWVSGSAADFQKLHNGVVLGQRAAVFLKAGLNSSVQIGHGQFVVTGIIKTANGFEDGGVFMPLPEAQEFFHKDGSSVITIKLRSKDDAAAFKQQVKAHFPALVALEDDEFSRTYSQFKILKATAWAVGGCGLLLGGLGVANTMIMSVFTRIREIAILRVNGFSNMQIAAMIFGESAVVSVLGAVVGLTVGTAFLYLLKQIPALHGYVDTTIQVPVVVAVILLALLTGLAGALYPAFYAMRIRAVEALRFE